MGHTVSEKIYEMIFFGRKGDGWEKETAIYFHILNVLQKVFFQMSLKQWSHNVWKWKFIEWIPDKFNEIKVTIFKTNDHL